MVRDFDSELLKCKAAAEAAAEDSYIKQLEKEYIGKFIYTKLTYLQSVAHVVKITEIFSNDGEVIFYNSENDDFCYSRQIVAFCDTEEEANNYLKKDKEN